MAAYGQPLVWLIIYSQLLSRYIAFIGLDKFIYIYAELWSREKETLMNMMWVNCFCKYVS